MKLRFGLAVTSSIRLVRPLGRGGMGSVWVAHHDALKTEVAVKFLSADLLEHEGAHARFLAEATAAAQIKNPHGVHVYDHGILDDHVPYIVMERLEGEALSKRLERGPLTMHEASQLLVQLSRVLHKAHDLGIVHRDLKPDNIMVLSDYGDFFVKLIDFGIAKMLNERAGVTQTGMMVGTPEYMCPEQFHSAKDVGPAADRWGLAVVLFHSLTGRLPFFGPTLPAVIMAVEKAEFLLPFATWQLGNAGIDDFFRRALQRDPTKRFDTLRDMVAAWHDALGLESPEVTGTVDPRLIPTRNDLPNGGVRDEERAEVAESYESNDRPSKETTPGWTAPSASDELPRYLYPGTADDILGPQPNDNPTVGAIPSKMRRSSSGVQGPAARRPRWVALLAFAAVICVGAVLLLRGTAVSEAGVAAQPDAPASAEVPAREALSPELEPRPSAKPPVELEPSYEKSSALTEPPGPPPQSQATPQKTPSVHRESAPLAVPPRAKPASKPRTPAPAFKDRGF